jgi:hypothetical protein
VRPFAAMVVVAALFASCEGGMVTVAENTGSSLDVGTANVAGVAEPGSTPTSCPPQQWNCAARQPNCGLRVSKGTLPAGCICEPNRPLSGASCAQDETMACLQVSNAHPELGGSDAFLLVQCACLPVAAVAPDASGTSSCLATLQRLFPTDQSYFTANLVEPSCIEPAPRSCDADGGCHDISAEEQRRQGVAYGCTPLGPAAQ